MPQIIAWIAQVIVAAILAQTLFFKLTYAPETQTIFAQLGGRPAATASAVVELVAVILLLIPRTAIYGALLALTTISGAIMAHLFLLGVRIPDPSSGGDDGGLLFILAWVVAVASSVIVWLRWHELPFQPRKR